MSNDLVPFEERPPANVVQGLLARIRPAWRAKSLIERVERILPTDPSSACQRLLNASIHDLREKVVLAGIDIAQQAAKQQKLPLINASADVEQYSTDKLIDLAYAMGLLSHAEWRRVKRCYEIRRDLEHEDDQYEAGIQDCVYIFTTCIDVILSKDPLHLLRVVDVKELIEQPAPLFPSKELLDDFEGAPEVRQSEIVEFLISIALNEQQPDIVRSNAFEMLKHLEPLVRAPVRVTLAGSIQERIGRKGLSLAVFKVANACGALPYLKIATRRDFFAAISKRLDGIGPSWGNYSKHRAPLEELEDVGGVTHCPDEVIRSRILRWIVLCYIGWRGGQTSFGHVRRVFYSDTAAPIIKRIIAKCSKQDLATLRSLRSDIEVQEAMNSCPEVAARFEDLLDLAGEQ